MTATPGRQALLVLTTCANAQAAEGLAEALVEQRLAACINILNHVTSIYRWRDRIERDEETLLVIKTTEDRFQALQEAIRARSAYELPEVVAIGVQAGSRDYLSWLGACVEPGPGRA